MVLIFLFNVLLSGAAWAHTDTLVLFTLIHSSPLFNLHVFLPLLLVALSTEPFEKAQTMAGNESSAHGGSCACESDWTFEGASVQPTPASPDLNGLNHPGPRSLPSTALLAI